MAKKHSDKFSGQEANQRFEAALRGARMAGANPSKTVAVKRGRPKGNDDPMPTDDPEALIEWAKRNIQGD